MSSFLTGFMSVGKKLGSSVENWAQGSKIGRDISNARQSKINPFYKAKNQPGSKNESDTGSSALPRSQEA